LKKIIVIIIILVFSSCKEKDTCYPEFKESLAYLKEFSDPKDEKTRLVDEIYRNIEVVESTSGILNQDSGMNLIRHITVTEKDINRWEKWVAEKCSMDNNFD
jgi:hypothetical protein